MECTVAYKEGPVVMAKVRSSCLCCTVSVAENVGFYDVMMETLDDSEVLPRESFRYPFLGYPDDHEVGDYVPLSQLLLEAQVPVEAVLGMLHLFANGRFGWANGEVEPCLSWRGEYGCVVVSFTSLDGSGHGDLWRMPVSKLDLEPFVGGPVRDLLASFSD
jgi:hypothetical protein